MEYTNILTVLVQHGVPQADAELLARAIANSPAKTMMVVKAMARDYKEVGLENLLADIRLWGIV